jgi:cell division protein FtsB
LLYWGKVPDRKILEADNARLTLEVRRLRKENEKLKDQLHDCQQRQARRAAHEMLREVKKGT